MYAARRRPENCPGAVVPGPDSRARQRSSDGRAGYRQGATVAACCGARSSGVGFVRQGASGDVGRRSGSGCRTCRRRRRSSGRCRWRLRESHAERDQPIVLRVDVVDGEGGERDPSSTSVASNGPDRRVLARPSTSSAVGVVGRDDREPRVVAEGDVVLLLEAEHLGVEGEGRALVVDEDAARSSSRSSSFPGLRPVRRRVAARIRHLVDRRSAAAMASGGGRPTMGTRAEDGEPRPVLRRHDRPPRSRLAAMGGRGRHAAERCVRRRPSASGVARAGSRWEPITWPSRSDRTHAGSFEMRRSRRTPRTARRTPRAPPGRVLVASEIPPDGRSSTSNWGRCRGRQ